MLLAAANNQSVNGSSPQGTAVFYGAPPPRYAPPLATAVASPHLITTTAETAPTPAPSQYIPPGLPSIGYGYSPTPRPLDPGPIQAVSDVTQLPTVTTLASKLPNHWQFILGGALAVVLIALYLRSRR